MLSRLFLGATEERERVVLPAGNDLIISCPIMSDWCGGKMPYSRDGVL